MSCGSFAFDVFHDEAYVPQLALDPQGASVAFGHIEDFTSRGHQIDVRVLAGRVFGCGPGAQAT